MKCRLLSAAGFVTSGQPPLQLAELACVYGAFDIDDPKATTAYRPNWVARNPSPRASDSIQAAMWYSALETKVAAATLSLENVVFLQSRKRF